MPKTIVSRFKDSAKKRIHEVNEEVKDAGEKVLGIRVKKTLIDKTEDLLTPEKKEKEEKKESLSISEKRRIAAANDKKEQLGKKNKKSGKDEKPEEKKGLIDKFKNRGK